MIDDEAHLLDLDEEYTDPKDPCKPYVCKVMLISFYCCMLLYSVQSNGLTQTSRQCADIDTCTDGDPPYILPGQCCPSCGNKYSRGKLKVHHPYNSGGGPGEPDELTAWAEWTECSKTCGGGARARRRECEVTEEGVLINCNGETLQIEDCNSDACPGIVIYYWIFSLTFFNATLCISLCFLAVPCLWVYREPGECCVTCGEGICLKYPMIIQNASNGGQDCPPFVVNGDPVEGSCEGIDCPGKYNFKIVTIQLLFYIRLP